MPKIKVVDLGRIKYVEALEIQEQLFNQLIQNKIAAITNVNNNVLLLCEHYPVITLGKSAKEHNILLSNKLLTQHNIDLFHISRGGDVTFHGVGQLTGYPILDLAYFTSDLKHYLRMLEEVIIQTLAHFRIVGYRIEGITGVWVNSVTNHQPKKIAAFGVKSSRWITMHGFSLNITVDLNYFNFINPCGITDKGVTSMFQELQQPISIEEVKPIIEANFLTLFNAKSIK